MKLTFHGYERLLERTKLSKRELYEIFRHNAYVHLGHIRGAKYLLFYDYKEAQCCVACVKEDDLVTILLANYRKIANSIRRRITHERRKEAEELVRTRVLKEIDSTLTVELLVKIQNDGSILHRAILGEADAADVANLEKAAVLDRYFNAIMHEQFLLFKADEIQPKLLYTIYFRGAKKQIIRESTYSSRQFGLQLNQTYNTHPVARLVFGSEEYEHDIELGPVPEDWGIPNSVEFVTAYADTFKTVAQFVDECPDFDSDTTKYQLQVHTSWLQVMMVDNLCDHAFVCETLNQTT